MAAPDATSDSTTSTAHDSQGSPAQAPEQPIWRGHPSHWTGWRGYALALMVIMLACAVRYFVPAYEWSWLGATIAVAILPAFWQTMVILSTTYQLTSQRLTTARGILVRQVEELELYRVKDTTLVEPLGLRLIGRGHVVLKSSDFSNPTLTLYAIARPARVRELIRQNVEAVRQAKGVREIDVERSATP